MGLGGAGGEEGVGGSGGGWPPGEPTAARAEAPSRGPTTGHVEVPHRGPTAAHAEGPPPGHTGGFGEPTCQSCHGDFDVGFDGTLAVTGLPRRWEPGATYTVTLELRSRGTRRAGFQAAFRFAEGDRDGTQAGEPAALDPGVVIHDGELGVAYVQHAPGGTWTDGADVATWSFTWTAPDEPGPSVAFHAAANSTNGDNSPIGDIVYAVADTVAGP